MHLLMKTLCMHLHALIYMCSMHMHKKFRTVCVHVYLSFAQDYQSERYAVLYYGNNKACALRRKFGDKKQIFSYGGKKTGWDEGRLRKLGDEALRKLDAGESEKDVEGWAKAKFK